MKRSEINDILHSGDDFMRRHGYFLPPFAYWSPEQMKANVATDYGHIRDQNLGWYLTDYGWGDFAKSGLLIFVARSGDFANLGTGRGTLYGEKIMVARRDQVSPSHRHDTKTEDIINRGGASLAIRLHSANTAGGIDADAPVHILCDGCQRVLSGGEVLILEPGESATLEPRHWHSFWGEGGDVLIGEVSNVNNERTDNIFHEKIGPLSPIDEDTGPAHLLLSDYATYL